MFKLIKLAMYALVGYVLYELYQGMTADDGAGPRSNGARSGGRRQMGAQMRSGGQRRQSLTGAGEGRAEQTLDNDGGSVPHRVGRGVTSS